MKTIGNIKTLHIDITQPMRMEYQQLEFRDLNIIVGTNGAGKTFILVLSYIYATIAALIVAKVPTEIFKVMVQKVFDTCYDDQNITGTITVDFTTDDASITVTLDNGKVKNLSARNFSGIDTPTPAKFLSAGMRTFDDIKNYLSIRQILMDTMNITNDHILLEEMLKRFKMYDVTHIEALIKSCPIAVSEEMREHMKKFDMPDRENIVFFNVDLTRNDFFFVMKDETTRYLTTYSKGHQSLFNMMFASLPGE